MHVQRESPFPLFKIDIFHIRFYHAIAVTRHRYPLKNLSWVLHGISSSIGNLEDGGKSRGKGGRRTVDKLEIQRIEQLYYVSMGGGWMVGGIAHELHLSTFRRGEASILRGYEIGEGGGLVKVGAKVAGECNFAPTFVRHSRFSSRSSTRAASNIRREYLGGSILPTASSSVEGELSFSAWDFVGVDLLHSFSLFLSLIDIFASSYSTHVRRRNF